MNVAFNRVDVVLVSALVLLVGLGVWKGLTRQVLHGAALLGAGFLTAFLAPRIAQFSFPD